MRSTLEVTLTFRLALQACDAPSARLLCELTGLLSVLVENNPPACAAIACLPAALSGVPTDQHMPNAGVRLMLDGMLGRWRPFQTLTETPRGDLYSSRLHCASVLTQFLAAGPEAGVGDLSGLLETSSLSGDSGEMRGVLPLMLDLLVATLQLSDEVCLMVFGISLNNNRHQNIFLFVMDI